MVCWSGWAWFWVGFGVWVWYGVWDPRVGLRPRVFCGCGLVAEGFVGFWWCAGLWVAPWVECQLGLLDGCCSGLVVVRGWVWVCLVGFSLLVWVVLVLGWVWGLGWPGFYQRAKQYLINECWFPPLVLARVLLMGQTVPDQ